MQKIGFWKVFGIMSGVLGTGIFLVPAPLSSYGHYSLFAWVIACLGAMSLAYLFANLCILYPQTGGPYIYVKAGLGNDCAFFVGFIYWFMACVGNIVVIIGTISYLKPIINGYTDNTYFLFKILVVIFVTMINLFGISFAGLIGVILGILKFIPLILVPLLGIWNFNLNNFILSDYNLDKSNIALLSESTLLILWCFIGLESITAIAGSVKKPKKTIALAIIAGTLFVTLIYVFNYVTLVSLLDINILQLSDSPYIDVSKLLFPDNSKVLVSLLLSITSLQSLNSWILVSSQIALGLSKDEYFPKIFLKRNRYEAPYISLLISSMVTILLLSIVYYYESFLKLSFIIDISVIPIIYIYFLCSLSYIIIYFKLMVNAKFKLLSAIFSIFFCLWVIFNISFIENIIGISFVLLTFPFFLIYKFPFSFKNLCY